MGVVACYHRSSYHVLLMSLLLVLGFHGRKAQLGDRHGLSEFVDMGKGMGLGFSGVGSVQ